MDVLKGIFSRNIQKRNAIYSEVEKGGATHSAARLPEAGFAGFPHF
jgi:hypothetical protein